MPLHCIFKNSLGVKCRENTQKGRKHRYCPKHLEIIHSMSRRRSDDKCCYNEKDELDTFMCDENPIYGNLCEEHHTQYTTMKSAKRSNPY